MNAREIPDKTYLALLRGINVGGKNIIKGRICETASSLKAPAANPPACA